jgi:ArsR family transcriptional regulator, arsenate/arsenite/antimonite-responsive transcriptional repressor
MTKCQAPPVGDVAAVAAALGDEGRVRIVAMLRGGELCLCHIIEVLGLAPSTVSRHVSILREAGLIRQRKEGRWHFYRLDGGAGASAAARRAVRWAVSALEGDPTVAADAAHLRRILRKRPEEVAMCYKRGAAGGRSVPGGPAR